MNLLQAVGRSRVSRVLVSVLALALAGGSLTAQQRTDTSRAAIDTTGPTPERRPPLSPRRAFLYSLLLPGYSQSVLGRPRAGSIQLAFETVGLTMIRLSAADVREARRVSADSIPVSFVNVDGQPEIRFERTAFPGSLLRSRRARLEDWIAVRTFVLPGYPHAISGDRWNGLRPVRETLHAAGAHSQRSAHP